MGCLNMRWARRWVVLLLVAACGIQSAHSASTNSTAHDILLLGPFGTLVPTSTNAIPDSYLPPADQGIQSQIPTPARGTPVSERVQSRQRQAREGKNELRFFPDYSPALMSYLASQDEFGNTAIHPGPLITYTPLDTVVQQAKYQLSQYGLRYSLSQTLTYAGMTDVMQGANNLGFYTLDFAGTLAVFDAPAAGTAGWVTAQFETKASLGSAAATQDAQRNLGTITDPTAIWSSVNGIWIPQLAWQQSFHEGQWVVVAGMVNQGNYFDGNAYANNGRAQFLNSALINSMVLPLPGGNLGANVQWQPVKECYAMLGGTVGNAPAGQLPWDNFSWEDFSVLGEFGYVPENFLGLGPGAYRVQPFVARAGGPTQGGLGFNLQQQLGANAPFGWFGRFGFGGAQVTGGAAAQIGTGFVMRGPLQYIGLFPSRDNDAAGIGLVWSQPSATTQTVYHENEMAVEMGYSLQLTATTKLVPDLQVVWNRAFNPNAGPALVCQVQLDFSW